MSHDLIIPIYVDTNALLDLLASIEGGFSAVEKITTQNASNRSLGIEGKLDSGTEFGIPNVLSLLKVTLGLSGKAESSRSEAISQETERYHTYGSLFHRLREYLEDNQLLNRIDDTTSWETIQASNFVEIHGLIQSNPLVASLQKLDRFTGIAELFTSSGSGKPQNQQGRNNNQQGKNTPPKNDMGIAQIRNFLKGLLKDLQNEQIGLFIADSTNEIKFRAVLALFVEYLRDKSLLEINNKEFYILGKVVRKIEKDDPETIDLLAGTGLGGMEEMALKPLLDALSSIPNFKLPVLETKVSGPALEIVPIAIFV